MSQPRSDHRRAAPAWLVGEGPGARAPAGVGAALAAAGPTAGQAPPMLWLDATQGVSLLADPGARFGSATALAAWARRLWVHYGIDSQGAALPAAAVWRSRSRCAASLTNADVAAWQASANGAPAPVAGVAPLWAGALALATQRLHALRRRGRLLVVEGKAVTVIDIADAEIQRWELAWLDSADAAGLEAWVDAAAIEPVAAIGHSLPGAPPARLRVLQPLDSAPQDFADSLEPINAPSFMSREPMAARWGWAVAGTAALVLAASAWEATAVLQEREAALLALTAVEARPARFALTSNRRGEGATLPAAIEDAARLAAPWATRFAVAEAAAPEGGHWLRLEQARGETPLRMAGTAATPAAAFALTQQLAQAPGVADAAVMRSEAAAGPASGAATSRFELSISWRAEQGR